VAALLRFSRREEFHFEAVELGELARATIDTFRPRLEATGIHVELDLGHDVVVRADREKLRQVLVNLVENAIDALANGAPEKSLVLRVGRSRGQATMLVADSGPGVAAEALPHLFEPFFSLKENGTGLGLAIAKRTIDAHGGRIAAASTPGAGMTVRIELPPETPA
jgi:polar amino acid transport system substrate-binding protein